MLFFMCWVGVNTSQPAVTMEMQPGQDNMVPLILNAGDSHQHQNLQLSPTSPPLTLSQVYHCSLHLITTNHTLSGAVVS